MPNKQINFEAKIGDWKKTISFEGIDQVPELFLHSLSFLLYESAAASKTDMTIRVAIMDKYNPKLKIIKRDRIVSWQKGLRTISRNDFHIIIHRNLQIATISLPICWEDLADLIESWVGLMYEAERGVRLHAVAFKPYTLIATSGFGKTYLATHNLNQLIADEVLYVKDSQIENWHSSVRTKEPGPWKTRHGERKVLPVKTQPQALPKISFAQCSFLSVFFGSTLR